MAGFPTLPPIFGSESVQFVSPPPKIYVQSGDPTSTSGFKPNQVVMNAVSGDVFQLNPTNGTYGWQKVGNVRGPAGVNGDGRLDPDELASVIGQIEDTFESEIDPVLLFENALL